MNRQSSSFSLSTAFLAVFILALAFSFIFSGQQSEAAVCVNITRVMYRGATDRATGGQVSKLQQFLKDQGYFAFSVSGYFGPATEGALKQFQRRYAIVSSGNAATTGYGATGTKTRAKINSLARCAGSPPSQTTGTIAQNTTPPPTTPPASGNTLPAGASASCSPGATSVGLNSTVTWSSSVSGLTNPTYKWEGTDGLLGNFATVVKTYTQYGTKRATLTLNNRYVIQCTSFLVDANLPAFNQQPLLVQQPGQTVTPPPPAGVDWPVAGLTTAPVYAFGVDNAQYTYLGKWYWLVDGNSMRNMAEALSLVAQMPPGRRAFSSLNAHNIMNTHPDDRCQSSAGNPPTYTPYQCPWYDNGVASVQQKFTDFANAFKAAGGQIDYLILDSEQAFHNWVIGSGSGASHAAAIDGDPRLPALISQLQSSFGGFPGNSGSIVQNTLSSNPAAWGPFASPSSAYDNYLKWNSFMDDRFAGYVNAAIYNPIRAQFPSVKASDYQYFYRSASYPIPDENGHKVYNYGTGSIVGTHQGRALYGWINQISDPSKSPIQGVAYDLTPFNAFKYDANAVRAMRLSSSAPLSPWFSPKSWTGEPPNFPTFYTNSDYYTENILHTGLMTRDPDFFIFWNRGPVGTVADDLFFEQSLVELNTVAGYSGRQPIFSGLIPWDSSFVYTGSQVGAFKVWRFTPRLSGSQSIEQVTTADGKSDFTESVVFTANGRTITFPNAFIYKPLTPVSHSGAWVIQRNSAGNPQVALGERSAFFAAAGSAIDSYADTLYAFITRPFVAGFWHVVNWLSATIFG